MKKKKPHEFGAFVDDLVDQLAVELCRREGKKKQVNIAQMREILCKIAEIENDSETDLEPSFILKLYSKLC
jgi:hypothetical protein